MAKNLVIVESPAKAKTIEKFLGKDYIVKSSFGHVMDLAKKDFGVDIENGFKPNYEVSADKKKLVAELKKEAKAADMVWLASDEDREGEAIAWHLFNALKLDKEKTRRIVFHEITKTAIVNAIENPRDIDIHIVNAQQARRVLDRLVGYEISPVLWRKVKPSLSAGRVQSVAVRLIVEKENDITAFQSSSSYKVIGKFFIDATKETVLNADLAKKFKTKEEAQAFLNSCIDSVYKVAAIEKKPGKRSPAPPFTTSTLQQEASRKLGYGVSKTMVVAQQLYEKGLITYMRTDSVNLSQLAIGIAKDVITNNYGEEYSKTRNFSTKTKGAQEAHEAIRPSYLDKQTITGDNSQQRLYDLIWKRTIASQMAEAKLEKTTISIDISKSSEKMKAQGEVIIFDGFLKVYMESRDDDGEQESKGLLPPLKNGQSLDLDCMLAAEKFTKHPPRYSEASLVKKMEELGIGRPSTYAPTISTIQKRGYVIKDDRDGKTRNFTELRLNQGQIEETLKSEIYNAIKNKLLPTDIGILVNKFLTQHFDEIVDFQFTAKVEKEFDAIATGKNDWNKMIGDFYHPFKIQVENTLENAEREKGERLLGVDPKSSKNMYARIGRFGPMVQIGEADDEEKPRFASLKKGQSITNITFEEALELFKFPIKVGEIDNKVVNVAIGRFGPYVSHNKVFASIPKGEDPAGVDFARAVELLEEKKKKDAERFIKGFEEDAEVQVLNGRWGPYIKYKKKNYKIPKTTEAKDLSLKECLELIEKQGAGKTKAKTTTKKKATTKKKTPKKK
ncbi:MAG: DNA topoisomerase I [Bacteroidetes bacterium 4572_77]|nr:MAG: DNA topoisomerase I [Bacteroidetes bacterium 4572_77]